MQVGEHVTEPSETNISGSRSCEPTPDPNKPGTPELRRLRPLRNMQINNMLVNEDLIA